MRKARRGAACWEVRGVGHGPQPQGSGDSECYDQLFTVDHFIYSALKQGALLPPAGLRLQPMPVQSKHSVYAVQIGGHGVDACTFVGLYFWHPNTMNGLLGACEQTSVANRLLWLSASTITHLKAFPLPFGLCYLPNDR